MARRYPEQKQETPLVVVLSVGILLGIFVALAWIVASHKIVYGSMSTGLSVGSMWKFLPGDYGIEQWNWLVTWVERGLGDLNSVSFPQWLMFVNVAFQPLAVVLMVVYLPVVFVLARKKKTAQRRFTPDALIKLSSEKFTGNLPIVAIRRAIAADRLPGWRLPVQPEEVLKKWRVPASSARSEWAGRTICNFGKASFDGEVARLYFTGLRSGNPGRRMESDMLGRQIVDLVRDAEHAERIVFSDRFSNEGKALIALWAPVCFAGAAGRAEYQVLKDALNRSAYGTSGGMANLTLAQEQYNKYRAHPELRSLFAVHHWEFTALFALLKRAQRFGVFTTAEVLWLRPTNRILFAALNSCGRHTPHLEGAAVFSMHRFEHECARMKRLPLMPIGPGGELQPTIFVNKAVDALQAEFVHLVDAVDEEEDIWVNAGIWKRTNSSVLEWARQAAAQQAESAALATQDGDSDLDNPFDRLMRKQAEDAQRREQSELEQELQGLDF
jgi:hypothetical protein